MASKTFLTQNDLAELQSLLDTPPPKVTGNEDDNLRDFRKSLTHFIGKKTLAHFREMKSWTAARPVLLGSLARGELCPRSDVDLMFLGPDDAIHEVLQSCQERGWKIGYRKPKNSEDWTEGVEFKDCLSLLQATAEHDSDRQLVHEQKRNILDQRKLCKTLVQTISKERLLRSKRYGGAVHFLEPNIKYSPGALRDIYQGEVVRIIDPSVAESHGDRVLEYYKDFFLIIRIWTHIFAGGEILASALQMDCAKWFQYSDLKDFMREVQKGFGRANFYSSLYIEKVSKRRKDDPQVSSVSAALELLLRNPSLQTVGKIREFVVSSSSEFKLEKTKKSERHKIRQVFQKIFRSRSDEALQALFHSRIIDHVFKELKPLIGYVQHDQYHRFTADQHILQALRETLSVCTSPKKIGKLSKTAKALTSKDWEMLFWVALFHDMAKGRAEDHSTLGELFVQQRLEQLGFQKAFIAEVCWMVKNHLALSQAAFRENPLASDTWHNLFQLGMNPTRLKRLTVFTAIDICATNPDAWTGWKSDLLHNLFLALSEGPAESIRVVLEKIREKKNAPQLEKIIRMLDPFLVEALSPSTLIRDLEKIIKVKSEVSLSVHKDRLGRTWIRFFDCSDKKGLFLSYVSKLYFAGVSIHHASIHTLNVHPQNEKRVYDWFCVGKINSNSVSALEKRLEHSLSENAVSSPVTFESIELVHEVPEGVLISFRGRDQKGALLEASKGLLAANFEIVWARVHTWGRDLDDQFFVKSRPDLHPALQDLRRKLLNH